MVVTDSAELAEKCTVLKKNGASKRYFHTEIGWNFKLSDINAALGISQLKRIDKTIEEKNNCAKIYDELLEDVKGVRAPIVRSYNKSSYMIYSILAESNELREKIKNSLEKNGIETRINFPPTHTQPVYTERFGHRKGECVISEDVSERILGLPIYINITENEQQLVVNTIKEAMK